MVTKLYDFQVPEVFTITFVTAGHHESGAIHSSLKTKNSELHSILRLEGIEKSGHKETQKSEQEAGNA